MARRALRSGRSSLRGGSIPAQPLGGTRASSGAGTDALGSLGADDVSGLRARVSFLEDALARTKIDGTSSNGVRTGVRSDCGDHGAAVAATASAAVSSPGAAAAVRHDWTREQIREIFDTPLMELVFRAAATHRAFFHPLEVQQSTLLCECLVGRV